MLGNGDELFPDADADNSDEGFHPNITEVILEESETNEEEEVKVIG